MSSSPGTVSVEDELSDGLHIRIHSDEDEDGDGDTERHEIPMKGQENGIGKNNNNNNGINGNHINHDKHDNDKGNGANGNGNEKGNGNGNGTEHNKTQPTPTATQQHMNGYHDPSPQHSSHGKLNGINQTIDTATPVSHIPQSSPTPTIKIHTSTQESPTPSMNGSTHNNGINTSPPSPSPSRDHDTPSASPSPAISRRTSLSESLPYHSRSSTLDGDGDDVDEVSELQGQGKSKSNLSVARRSTTPVVPASPAASSQHRREMDSLDPIHDLDNRPSLSPSPSPIPLQRPVSRPHRAHTQEHTNASTVSGLTSTSASMPSSPAVMGIAITSHTASSSPSPVITPPTTSRNTSSSVPSAIANTATAAIVTSSFSPPHELQTSTSLQEIPTAESIPAPFMNLFRTRSVSTPHTTPPTRSDQRRLEEVKKQERTMDDIKQQWLNVLSKWDEMRTSKRVKTLCWHGIPPSVRSQAWQRIIGNDLHITTDLYEILCQRSKLVRQEQRTKEAALSEQLKQDTEEGKKSARSLLTWNDAINGGNKENSLLAMDLDIPRTFPELKFFHDDGPLEAPLYEILESFVCYRPDIGYVQGMSYLAAMLALNMEPYLAFVALANLLNRPMYFSFFRINAQQMSRYLELYQAMFKEQLPIVFAHFEKLEITPNMYLYEWWITIFSRSLPLDLSHRIWDNFLCVGQSFLFRTALGIIKMYQETLLQSDFENCILALTRLPPDMDAEQLFAAIAKIEMSSKHQQRLDQLAAGATS